MPLRQATLLRPAFECSSWILPFACPSYENKGVQINISTAGTMRCIDLLVGIVLSAACGVGMAQDYPRQPIRILVGFSPGSTTDILARTVGQKISEAWRQPVLV